MPLLPSSLFLVAVAAAAPAQHPASKTITDLIAAAAAQPGIDVLTSEDVRRAASLEAEQQSAGCNDTSCLAELAQALGARVVLYGTLATLSEQELVLTVNLFDSQSASSAGRAALRAPTMTALADRIDVDVRELVARARGPASNAPLRLLVLDIQVVGDVAALGGASAPASTGGPSWLTVAGAGTAVVGAGAVVVGWFFDRAAVDADRDADNPRTTQRDAVDLYDARDRLALGAALGYAGGAVLTVAGAALIGVDLWE